VYLQNGQSFKISSPSVFVKTGKTYILFKT
jgi:hypothetical protein